MNRTKIFSILVITLVAIMMLTTIVSASSDVLFKPEDYTPTADSASTANIKKTGQKILGIIQVVGNLVAVGMLIILGIKYMVGSAEEKAANKKSMLPYIIGAVFLFGAVNIASLVYSWSINLAQESTTPSSSQGGTGGGTGGGTTKPPEKPNPPIDTPY